MAVVYVREVYRGVGMKVAYSGRDMEASINRKFLVRVDSMTTPGAAICAAPGIRVGHEHPAIPKWVACEFNVDCEDGAGLMWSVNVNYKGVRKFKTDGLPEDEWSITNNTTMFPAVAYYPNPSAGTMKSMQNSAGSPIEGLKVEGNEFSWKLVRAYKTAGELLAACRAASNHTNGSAWDGGEPGSWKADLRSGSKKKLDTPNQTNAGNPNAEWAGADGDIESTEDWEGVWEFRYDANGWALRPWDAGYMQKVDSQGMPSRAGTSLAAIRGRDGKPVKEQWKLDGYGVALPVGADPVRAKFEVYRSADFGSQFGNPPA